MAMNPQPRWYFFVALVSITFIGPLSIHLFLPAMPAVKAYFGVSTGVAQLTLSLEMLSMACVTLAYGGLSDRFGRKRVLLAGLTLFTAGATLCLVSVNMGMLLAGRVLQGAGAGCGVVLARAIARDVYGLDRVAQAVAYLTAAYVMGPLIAPPLGGALTDAFGWRALFAFATTVGVLVILGTAFVIPETRAAGGRGGGRGMIAGYRSLLRKRRFVGFALQPGFISGAFFAHATASSFLAIEVMKRPATEFGLWFFLFPAGFMVASLVSGRIGSRVSIERMAMLGSAIALFTAVLLGGWLALDGLSMPALFIPGFFIGAAQGVCLPYAQAGAMGVDPDLAGSASGAVVFSQFFWPAALQQLTGLLADGTWRPMAYVVTGAALCSLASGALAVSAGPPQSPTVDSPVPRRAGSG